MKQTVDTLIALIVAGFLYLYWPRTIPFPAHRFELDAPCVEIYRSGTYDDLAHVYAKDISTSFIHITVVCAIMHGDRKYVKFNWREQEAGK